MDIDVSMLFDEVWKLGCSLYNGVSKDRETDESRSLTAYNTILYDLTGQAFNCSKIIYKHPYLRNKIIRENNKGLELFFDRVRKDERIFKILFANYYNLCIDTDIFNYTLYPCEKKFTDKEVKDIILGFYSLFGDRVYSVVKRYFDEARIQTGSGICEKNTDATFYNSLLLKSGYIVVKEKENNIKLLAGLVHELGHAVDYGTYYHPQQKKGKYYSDIYQEVSSKFFEYSFIKYLMDNRIECDESLFYRAAFIKQTFYEICMLVDTYTEGNMFSTDIGDMIKNSNAFVYALGGVLGIGMNQVMGKDYLEYMKKFNDFICSRNEGNFVDLICMAGIDDIEYINGRTFETEFDEVSKLLKRKHNIKE